MNKLLKGAIAGAAGVALLLGGAGTFALWNSSATVTGGNIVAGELKITPDPAAGVWTHGTDVITDLSAYRIVPGDVLTYTTDLDVTATGNNLVATVRLGASSITAASADAEDVALAGYLTKSAVLTATGPGISGVGPTYTVAEGDAVATVTVTITFPRGALVNNNDAQLGSVNLSNMLVTLNQN